MQAASMSKQHTLIPTSKMILAGRRAAAGRQGHVEMWACAVGELWAPRGMPVAPRRETRSAEPGLVRPKSTRGY